MANAYITEFKRMGKADPTARGSSGRREDVEAPQIAEVPPVAHQVVVFTSATASDTLNASTNFVRIITDATCFVEFGSAPTATNSTSMYLPSGYGEYFGVPQGIKISFYDGSS